MIIIRQKLFAKEDGFANTVKYIFSEIIKILALGSQCPRDIDHWFVGIVGGLSSFKNNEIIRKSNKRIQSMLVGFADNDEINKTKLTNLKNKIDQKTPKEYFNYLWKEVYDQSVKENPKYQHIMDLKPDYYIFDQLWFILCCLTGQANEHSNYWDFIPGRVKISLSGYSSKLDPEILTNYIREIIFSIRPDILDAYENSK